MRDPKIEEVHELATEARALLAQAEQKTWGLRFKYDPAAAGIIIRKANDAIVKLTQVIALIEAVEGDRE